MVETVIPDVYIDVRPEGLIVPARIAVGTLGVVGTASRGSIETAVTLGDFPTARAAFGEYDAWQDGQSGELTLTRALELAFANGATSVLAVRVAAKKNDGTTAAVAAWRSLTSASGTAAVIRAATPGTWGDALQVQVDAAVDNPYVRDEKHLGNETPPITLAHTPVLDSARNRIQRFDSASGVTRVLTVVDEAATPGAGEVKIVKATGELSFGDTIQADDTITASYLVDRSSAALVTVQYPGPPLPVKETYTVVDGNDLVRQITGGPSQLVIAVAGDQSAELPAHTTGAANLSGGDNAAIGVDYRDGLDVLLNQTAHIIVAAGQDESFADELAAHCANASTDERKRDRIAVVGSAGGEGLDALLGNPVDSDRVVFAAPGIKTTDGAARPPADVTLPGSYAAAAVAGLIASLQPHISPTNKTIQVGGLEHAFIAPEIAQLLQARVLTLESRNGTRIVRGITTSTNTAWQQITTRRIVDYSKYGIRSAAEPYIGLLNNARVRAALRTTVNNFLAGMVNDEMLTSYDLDVTATRDEEVQGIARVTIILRPVFSIDYIQVTMFLQ
jgi:hypothetical protein